MHCTPMDPIKISLGKNCLENPAHSCVHNEWLSGALSYAAMHDPVPPISKIHVTTPAAKRLESVISQK